jgi:dUTP pyrophosphatase
MAYKYGMCVANAPGTIDEDYRGEIKVIMINLSKEKYIVQPGDRIAQGVINKVERAEFKEVRELSQTERGEGGFGHTGKQ